MLGLMQDWPLLTHKIIDHAASCHGSREVVSRSVEGPIHRTDYRTVRARSLRVAQRLECDGIGLGDRVATIAWNTWRHLEAFYGVAGVGAICHTINPRLFPDQIAWIINHAQDRILLADTTFVPLLEAIAQQIGSIERFVILTDRTNMPKNSLRNAVTYEEWIAGADGDFRWKALDEKTAAGLCYTSGTTGNPKGVLYSHRSTVLHSLLIAQPDFMGLRSTDAALPVVPFFHANGWGLPFHAPMTGSKLVLPGARLDGPSIYDLMRDEDVTFASGVPTVWLQLQQHMEAKELRLPQLKRLAVGGAAPPPSMIEAFDRMGIAMTQGWGMTEMGPIGANGMLKPPFDRASGEARLDRLSHQGVAPFLVEMKITDDNGRELPRDGKVFGHLKVRGASVVEQYYASDERILDDEGFFDTGDVATLDPHGYMRITDRSKDVIKSGGEWISSVQLENLAAGHAAVLEAAVIGIPHPTWTERPLLIVQLKPGATARGSDILDFLADKIPKWWIPDDVAFVESIPHSATGKVRKNELRERFRDFRCGTAVPMKD